MSENKVLVIPNKEKEGLYEEWYEGRDWANFPPVFRTMVMGIVNSGKTTTVLNLLIKQDPPFRRIIIAHPKYWAPETDDLENKDVMAEGKNIEIEEYPGVQFYGVLKYLPTSAWWRKLMNSKAMKKKKTLVIIDDINLKAYVRQHKSTMGKIEKLFSHDSSHFGLNIVITTQDASVQLPTFVLKNTTSAIIHKLYNGYQREYLSINFGIPNKSLKFMYDNLCKNAHDFIVYQREETAPYRYAINFYTKVPDIVDDFLKGNTNVAIHRNENIAEEIFAEMGIEPPAPRRTYVNEKIKEPEEIDGGSVEEVEDAIGKGGITTAEDLIEYINNKPKMLKHFKGIYLNRLPRGYRNILGKKDFIIMNKDNHWSAVYKDEFGEILEYDSFGRDLWPGVDEVSTEEEQKIWEENCGQRTINFLENMIG